MFLTGRGLDCCAGGPAVRQLGEAAAVAIAHAAHPARAAEAGGDTSPAGTSRLGHGVACCILPWVAGKLLTPTSLALGASREPGRYLQNAAG